MRQKILLVILSLVILSGFVSASLGYSDPNLPKLNKPLTTTINFNNNTGSTNNSVYAEIWETAQGDMDNVPDLYPTLDGQYLRLDTTNNPLTGDLVIRKAAPILNLSSTSGLAQVIIETASGLSAGVWSFRQATIGSNLEIYRNAFRVMALTAAGTALVENATITSTASVRNVVSPTGRLNISSSVYIDDNYNLSLREGGCYLNSPTNGDVQFFCSFNVSINGSQISLNSLNNTINGNVTISGVGNNFVVDTNDYAFISRLLPKVGIIFRGGSNAGITATGTTGYDQLRIDPILNQTILNTPLYTDTNGTHVPLPATGGNTTVFTVQNSLLNKLSFFRDNAGATLLGVRIFSSNTTDSINIWEVGTGSANRGNFFVRNDTTNNVRFFVNVTGNKPSTEFQGIPIKLDNSTNQQMDRCTLVAGTCTISNTRVTADTNVFCTAQSLGTVSLGQGLAISARTAGTSYTITSGSAIDTSVIACMLIEPI